MFDQITFHSVPGSRSGQSVQMMALSTCGFCRRGQEFLEKHQIPYEYVHLDTVDPAVKLAVKEEFKNRFGVTLSYPALIVDGTKHTIGYVKRQWETLLGLSHEDDVAEAEPLE